MSILSEIGTKVGTELKALDAKIVASSGDGKVLQVIHNVNNSTTASTANFDVFNFDFTPIQSNSKILISINIKASHNQSYSLYFTIGLDNNFDFASRGDGYPSATGSVYMETYGNNHSSNAQINEYTGSYMHQLSTLTPINIKVRSCTQGGTHYINKAYSYDDVSRGRPQSTITITEIAE